MSSFEELENQFQIIKEMAWKGQDFPLYQGVHGKPDDKKETMGYSAVNEHYLQAMKYMYERYKLRQVHKDMAEREVENLWLKYLRDKQAEEAKAKAYHEFEVKKQNISQWTKQLMNPKGKSLKELFKILFCKLLPALTNEVAAEKIKEGAGYSLLTGENNLTEEEKKELRKRYA